MNGGIVDLDIEELKTKLVTCVNQASAVKERRGEISRFLGSTAKWYQQAGNAIADAIKFKSDVPLVQHFGEDWANQLQNVKEFEPAAHLDIHAELARAYHKDPGASA